MDGTKHLHLDPKHFFRTTAPSSAIFQSLGLIPEFWFTSTKATVSESLEENYEFFDEWTEDTNAEVVNGLFMYPEDPPLQPLAKYWIDGQEEHAFQYQHAILAVCDKNGDLVKWTRMD